MSEFTHGSSEHEVSNTYFYHFAVGILKIDYKTAGYAEIRKVAAEWAATKGFKQVIVRKVSKDNYGIQFIYLTFDSDAPRIRFFRDTLAEKFGAGLYAHDYQESTETGDTPEIIDRMKDMVLLDTPIFDK